MLIIRQLRFRGIGRFVEEQVIDFDKLGMLIQVDGKNNNTGGSSGAAKSTIFNALDFLFGLNTIPNSVLQSRLTEDTIFVEGFFSLDGLPLTISRGKKLKIDLNGEVTTGSSKITEEKLDQIISIPRPLFRLMLHKKQGERGFFLSLSPREINDFLTDCLGLGRFKNHIDKLDNCEASLSKMIGTATINSESARVAHEALMNAWKALVPPPAANVNRDMILKLKAKADASNEDLTKLLSVHKQEVEALDASRPQSITPAPYDTSTIQQIEQDLTDIRRQFNELALKEKDRFAAAREQMFASKARLVDIESKIQKMEAAKTKAQGLAAEIKKIRDSLCPTCDQSWTTEAAKQKEASLLTEVHALKPIITEGQQANDCLLSEQEYLTKWTEEAKARTPEGSQWLLDQEKLATAWLAAEKQKEREYYDAAHKADMKAMTDFEAQRKALLAKHQLAVNQYQGQANLDCRTLEMAVNEFKSYDTAKTQFEASHKSFEQKEIELTKKIEQHFKEVCELNAKLIVVQELKKAVKSYLSCSFDEALEFISDAATKRVRNVPNMVSATVQLSGIKETKEGKAKEEVNALLHMDGDENIDIRSLCGGERSAIDLAVDLSVIELIEQKTNKGINIFVLDEPFTGLDTVCIEMALEVLKNSNTNKKLIIVDHNPEVKQMVESKVLVVRDGLLSKVIQS